jgi:hypothetical protein
MGHTVSSLAVQSPGKISAWEAKYDNPPEIIDRISEAINLNLVIERISFILYIIAHYFCLTLCYRLCYYSFSLICIKR